MRNAIDQPFGPTKEIASLSISGPKNDDFHVTWASADDCLIVGEYFDNGPDDYYPGCSGVMDNVGNLEHLRARDTTFVAVSNMPLSQLAAYWRRMGWTVPFYSSRGTSFSDDCGAGGGFGLSSFLRDGDSVYRTYFTTSRGVDRMRFDFNVLDLTPYGRQEDWEDSPAGWPQTKPYEWWRLHDEYAS